MFEKFNKDFSASLVAAEVAGAGAALAGIGIAKRNIPVATLGVLGAVIGLGICNTKTKTASLEAIDNYNNAIDDYNDLARKFNAQNDRFRNYIDSDKEFNQKIAEDIVNLGAAIFKTAMNESGTESATTDNPKESDDK